jgi:hypothetical protein
LEPCRSFSIGTAWRSGTEVKIIGWFDNEWDYSNWLMLAAGASSSS